MLSSFFDHYIVVKCSLVCVGLSLYSFDRISKSSRLALLAWYFTRRQGPRKGCVAVLVSTPHPSRSSPCTACVRLLVGVLVEVGGMQQLQLTVHPFRAPPARPQRLLPQSPCRHWLGNECHQHLPPNTIKENNEDASNPSTRNETSTSASASASA